MFLFYLFINPSYAVQTDQFKMNKSIVYNLVLKNQNDHSPLISLSPVQTVKSSFFFKNIYYSYSNSQFLEAFSRQSIYFASSTFKNLLNTVVSAEFYKEPDFNERTFYSSPNYDAFQYMITFRRCNFIEISNQNNIGNYPALYTRSLIFRVYSCVFRYCENSDNGGAINAGDIPFLLVNDCDFTSCTSGGSGGAFYCKNSALIVFRNAFQFCTANNIGGAFMYEDKSHSWDLIIQSNLFSKCQAHQYYYFYAQYNQEDNNTCYLYFNKFECQAEENGTYYVIFNQFNQHKNFSKFRNVYGDDNYNVHLSSTRTFSPTPSQSPTPIFTQSIIFSSSLSFSQSAPFTESLPFTQSNPFSASQIFTPSQYFTQSFVFTSSSVFTPSQELIPIASRSVSCSQSPFPTLSQTPLNTPYATPSISNTLPFTSSKLFTPPASPYATGTPTLSRTPCITWPKLSLGLIILAGIILLLGIIANIYLIMLCCKPSEIFVQQVI